MNEEKGKQIAAEAAAGERTWILNGSFHLNQGFTLFPVKNDELELYINHGISRVVTINEVKELKDSEHCANKEAVEFLLDQMPADASH